VTVITAMANTPLTYVPSQLVVLTYGTVFLQQSTTLTVHPAFNRAQKSLFA